MFFTHHTFQNYESGMKPRFCVWVDDPMREQDQSQPRKEKLKRYEEGEFKDFEAYRLYVTQALEQKKITKEKVNATLAEAKNYFDKKTEAETFQKKDREIEEKIRRLRDKDDPTRKQIIENAREQIKKDYITELNELRDFVRDEIESMGIKFEELNDKLKKEFFEARRDILRDIHELLIENNETRERRIVKELEREWSLGKECYEKAKNFFNNAERLEFLKFLRSKKIPAGDRMNINSLLVFADKMQGHWEDYPHFLRSADENVFLLATSLSTLNTLYDKWKEARPEAKDTLKNRLTECNTKLTNLSKELEENSGLSDDNTHVTDDWQSFRHQKESDLAKIDELLKGSTTENDHKFANAFLTAIEKEFREIQDNFNVAKKNASQAEIDSINTATESATPDKKDDEQTLEPTEVSIPKLPHPHPHHTPSALHSGYRSFKKFMTAKGKITWYSFHDIGQAFHHIQENWKRHMESITEDKSDGLALGMAGLIPVGEVQKRIHESEIQNEKKRARERKEGLKNYDYEDLICELGEWPAKDLRRAILEILAERGNLRMSDRRLIDIIVPKGTINKQTWLEVEKTGDYADIRRYFKDAIDKNYIVEPNYGQELLQMQENAQHTKQSFGEKLTDQSVAASGKAEFGVIMQLFDRTGVEGEHTLTGAFNKSIARGNNYAGCGDFYEIDLKGWRDKKISVNLGPGLMALAMIDNYLRGNVSAEWLMGFSKKAEGQGNFTAFTGFEDVVIPKKQNVNGQWASLVEEWGWVEHGQITDLGAKEIVNFFNSRAAEDKKGNARHIAFDSSTYKGHSSRHVGGEDFKNKVDNKIVSAAIKGSAVDIYDSTTKLDGAKHILRADRRTVRNMFKAANEEIIDALVMRQNKRYYGKPEPDLTGEKLKDFLKTKQEFRENTDARLDRGTRALIKMFENLKELDDPLDLLNKSESYRILETDPKTGKLKSNELTLEELLQHSLRDGAEVPVKLAEREPAMYEEIMRAFNDLRTKALNRRSKVSAEDYDKKAVV